MDRETQLDLEARLEDRLRADLGRLPVRPYAHYRAREPRGDAFMTRGVRFVGAASVLAVLVLIAIGAAAFLRDQRNPTAASPTPAAVATSPTTATPTPPTSQPTANSGLTTYEDLYLGYRISLPTTYRASASRVFNRADYIGDDSYTLRTAAEERASCGQPQGEIPSAASGLYLYVNVFPNPEGMTAVQWAAAKSTNRFQKAVPLTIDGREAVKLIPDIGGDTMAYLIRGTDRMYQITPTLWPNPHRLDEIADTFKVLTPQASPSATPRPSASPVCP